MPGRSACMRCGDDPASLRLPERELVCNRATLSVDLVLSLGCVQNKLWGSNTVPVTAGARGRLARPLRRLVGLRSLGPGTLHSGTWLTTSLDGYFSSEMVGRGRKRNKLWGSNTVPVPTGICGCLARPLLRLVGLRSLGPGVLFPTGSGLPS